VRLVAWFRSLPRAGRWLAALAVFIVVYFVLIEPLAERYGSMRQAAADNRSKLEEARLKAARRAQQEQVIALGLRRFGQVDPPGPEPRIAAAFNETIAGILDRHAVPSPTISTRRAVPLGEGPLRAALGEQSRVEKIVQVIEFEAAPEVAAAVLGELESSPVVAGVPSVQIRRADGRGESRRAVRAEFRVEAWVLREGAR
jgi:hypothetical protein